MEDGGPAFPRSGTAITVSHAGMTLRDYFAATALQGMISNLQNIHFADGKMLIGDYAIAKSAYELADAMLAARK